MRPSQRATGAGIGSPETGKFPIAFSVSAPHRVSCTVSATSASVAPPRQTAPMDVAAAQSRWSPSGTYLNTASYGLPPTAAWDALQAALEDWRHGRTSWEHWGVPGEEARGSFARLVGVPVENVAIAANVSTLLGMVAASVADGACVLAPDIEFTSVLFPFMAQAPRRERPARPGDRAAGEIGPDVDVVAFSAVQMATGEVADLAEIASAARTHDIMTVVDATQAVGWLPFDAAPFDVVTAHAYKWMLSPRGTAFMAVRPERLEMVVPPAAGWYAAEDPLATFFGPPLRLADGARRLDTSPRLVHVGRHGACSCDDRGDRCRRDP